MTDKLTMHRATDARNPADLAAAIAPHIAAILALLAPPAERADDLLPLAAAARRAGLKSVRVLKDAIRARELPAYGRQRDRAVRRADLDAWIASRRVVHAPIDDLDIERRMKRIAGSK